MDQSMWTKTKLSIIAAVLAVALIAIPVGAANLYDAEARLRRLRTALVRMTSGAVETRYQFHFTGEESADYYIQINKNGAFLNTGVIDGPKCTWTSTADDFVLISRGRLDLAQAVQEQRVSLSGVGPLCHAIVSSL